MATVISNLEFFVLVSEKSTSFMFLLLFTARRLYPVHDHGDRIEVVRGISLNQLEPVSISLPVKPVHRGKMIRPGGWELGWKPWIVGQRFSTQKFERRSNIPGKVHGALHQRITGHPSE
jgi:hypothetical protein